MFLPMELIAKCVGSPITVFLSNQHEVEGVLESFDSICRLVLRDAKHFAETAVTTSTTPATETGAPVAKTARVLLGEYRLMLLNAHHVHFLVPGGAPPAPTSS
jgi:U6 snRNA-associated Sm-like protein LSm5